MNNDVFWENTELRDDDIIIASTIKSGTTWLQQIVAQIVFEGEFEGELNNTSYWVDTLRDYSEAEMLTNINKQTHRRFFKTHSPANVVLKNVKDSVKYIFIMRDFRDVVWSFYNHFFNSNDKIKINDEITIKLRNSTSPYEFWNIIIKNKHLFNECKSYKLIWSYFYTIKTWLEHKDNKNVLILHFNELKQDLKKNIHKISLFLGYEYNEKTCDLICNKCTFEYMKKNSVNCVPSAFKNSNKFINKGTNKRWKNILKIHDLENYNKLIRYFFKEKEVKMIERGIY